MKDNIAKDRESSNEKGEKGKSEKESAASLFESIREGDDGSISMQKLIGALETAGIEQGDSRLEAILGKDKTAAKGKTDQKIDKKSFSKFLEGDKRGLINKALSNGFAIPDFDVFCKDIEKIFNNTKGINDGEVESKEEKKLYGVSICTVDGQKFRLGDHEEQFELQSVCKAINYPIALHERGEDKVHQHVGREPSGRGYNGLVLNEDGLPHNPMLNAGAIIVCSLIKPDLTVGRRLKHVEEIWTRLCGNDPVRLNKKDFQPNPSDRNMALCYYMKEQGAFPDNADLYKTMEFYGKCCALEITADQLAIAAASLANGGICPLTADTVFSPDNVRDCLSLMLSCGMYDYSGEFAFLVGLPAKSGVSGAMMVVVPGLMGIAIYSPPLDKLGNSIRGVEFCKELVNMYSLHKFDHVADPAQNKKDSRNPAGR